MIPLTRKENYLNEIVGWGNTAPEKPLTPEEFFFAAILGEAVQVPDLSNASRYELFLAKIAGYNVNVSPPTYTSPRLEFFLAKAAGMDIETPMPITKEEIFWANYKGREQIVEGVPPLTFKSNGANLSNYRIYGNTVNGESVGDLITEGEHAGEYRVPVTVTNGTDTETTNIYLPEQIKMVGDEAEYVDYGQQKQHRVRKNLWSGVVEQGAVSQLGDYISNTKRIRSKNVPLEPGTYAISSNLLLRVIYAFNDTHKIGLCASIYKGSYSYTITVPAGANNISIGMMKVVDGVEADITPSDFEWGQVEKGSEVTNYEPYIEDTELDVTLPALPTLSGTNTLSVGTEVQPSKVMVKQQHIRRGGK